MLIALVLMMSGALPEARYTVDNIVLTQSEMVWLLNEKENFERRRMRMVLNIGERLEEVEQEITELQAKSDATSDRVEKAAIADQIAAITSGTIERGKYAIKKLGTFIAPVAADARRETINAAYNSTNGQLRLDPNNNGALSRAESGWPTFLFNVIDTDNNNNLTPSEFQAYLDAL